MSLVRPHQNSWTDCHDKKNRCPFECHSGWHRHGTSMLAKSKMCSFHICPPPSSIAPSALPSLTYQQCMNREREGGETDGEGKKEMDSCCILLMPWHLSLNPSRKRKSRIKNERKKKKSRRNAFGRRNRRRMQNKENKHTEDERRWVKKKQLRKFNILYGVKDREKVMCMWWRCGLPFCM